MADSAFWIRRLDFDPNKSYRDLIYMCKMELSRLTCKLHELVKVDDGKDWFSQLAKVKFENSGHRVDVGSVGHVGQWVVTTFKRVAEVVDLNLEQNVNKIRS